MGTEEKLSFSLPRGRFTRGSTIKVRILGDRSQYRSVRLELLQVERKMKAKMDAKRNHAVVVNKVEVPEGKIDVELTIPGHLPNAYHGELIGWDYEVRLVGDRSGRPDDEQVEAIDLQGTEPTAGSDVGLLALRTSRGARLAALDGDATNKMREAVLIFAAVAATSIAIGLSRGENFWLVAGLVALVPVAYGAYNMWRRKRHGLHDVQFQPPSGVVRLGQPVVVQVGNAIGQSLEVGLVAYEISVESGGKHPIAVQHLAHAQWVPVIGPTVSLPTSTALPSGFAGEFNALHWVVGLRKADAEEGIQGLTARHSVVAITH